LTWKTGKLTEASVFAKRLVLGWLLLAGFLLLGGGVYTAVAQQEQSRSFSPACQPAELGGANSVLLIVTDNGLQTLQSVTDCESTLTIPPALPATDADPTALSLVAVRASQQSDPITVWGLAIVAGMFVTFFALWLIFLRRIQGKTPHKR
jgi:hypothetical protein